MADTNSGIAYPTKRVGDTEVLSSDLGGSDKGPAIGTGEERSTPTCERHEYEQVEHGPTWVLLRCANCGDETRNFND